MSLGEMDRLSSTFPNLQPRRGPPLLEVRAHGRWYRFP